MAAGDLVEVSRRIRRLQRQLRRRRAAGVAQKGEVTPKMAGLAIMVYVFSGHNLDMAAEFLAFKLHLGDDSMEDMRCKFEQLYMQEPVPQVVELMNDQCVASRSMRVMAAACTFIVHRQLYAWLREQNCNRGVAPSRAQMIRHALSLVPSDCPLEVQACVVKPLRGSARRQRAPLPTVMGSSCGHLASHFNSVSHRNAGEGGARVISERCNVYFVFR